VDALTNCRLLFKAMTSLLSNLLILVLLLISSVGPTLSNRATPFPKEQVVKRATEPKLIPFELVNRHIMLQLKVNDSRPLWFVLDTGDQYAIINLPVAKELGLKLRGQVRVGGAGAALQTGAFVDDAKFVVAGLDGFIQPITMALPIGHLASRLGQDFDGIIGSEFIEQFVVEIDYLAHVLRLHNKNDFVYNGPGESIPIKFMHGHPILEAEVTPLGRRPIKGSFVLDIGAGLALALYSPFVNEHGLLTDTKTIKSLGGAGAGGETTGRFGRVSELKVGKFVIAQPITLFSEDKAGAFASSALSGNIGARIAQKFRVFLDYGRRRIILEPNSAYGAPFDQASAGVSLIAEGKDYRTFRIQGVLDNSPASEAGLVKDDVILSIDNQDSERLTLSRLNELFEQPRVRKLKIRRGATTFEVRVTPRRLI
jgi:hypothetical protein